MSRVEWQGLALLIYVLGVLPLSVIAIIVLLIQHWTQYLAWLSICTLIGMCLTGEMFAPYTRWDGGKPGR